ncbi:type II toxin-antitoxin system RelE/ParE family toxin [Brucella tritici]|uniref:Type II toxin-antitoxin system RelE/ParE family toxin n=1 Tax=Brucella tritici TaxID=94626 RepID=A0A7X6JCV9_9HYPH|nr:type II toxin-antitoxin system RelE/ParE family toxin [Brucella tritici]KAB2661581.1 type II toxin-antitoxin system RelE/ParE family toxin [Brucella tritici]NKW11052.1 type II toxin-antitoxin system RelE/ParE family toxin [Brucella tritici]
MICRSVVLSPEAETDLVALYDWIAERASPDTALGYIDRLESYIRGFDYASERGTLRNDIREGLQTVGFERRVTIAFNVTAQEVIVLGLFYGGQNWQEALSEH